MSVLILLGRYTKILTSSKECARVMHSESVTISNFSKNWIPAAVV